MKTLWSLLVGFGLLVSSGMAATLHVAVTGDDGNDGSTWTLAKRSIQGAVDAAAAGDVILVSNGVYTATANPVVNITRLVEVRSVNGPEVTIIDGQGERRGVFIDQTTVSDVPVCIAGFTIANGFVAGSGSGAGIYINSLRDVNISDCIISNNIAFYGGGIRKASRVSNLTLSNCWFSHNEATNSVGGGVYAVDDGGRIELFTCRFANNSSALNGGGIYIDNRGMLMDNCQFISNTCSGSGGGVFLYKSPDGAVINRCAFEGNQVTSGGSGLFVGNGAQDVFVSNCVFRGNVSSYSADAVGAGVALHGSGGISSCLIVSNRATAGYGGDLVLGGKPVRCDNLTIAGNHANNSGGGGGLYVRANVTAELFNCIIYDNTKNPGWAVRRNINFAAGVKLTFNNCCTTPLSQLDACAGTNNFDTDPLFIGVVGDEYSYQLQPDSPCINTGTNQPWMADAVDLDEHARLDRFHHMVDVGCYKYVPIGTLFNFR